MMLRFLLLFVCLLIQMLPAYAAYDRVALVIGNADYELGYELDNPVHDAYGVAQKLEKLGFHVIYRPDANRNAFIEAMTQFNEALANLPQVAIFYYSGHGSELDGKNYLYPVRSDIKPRDKVSLRTNGIKLDDILGDMEQNAESGQLRIAIVDACRNNQFEGLFRGNSGGLAEREPGASKANFLIAFAGEPHKTVDDGIGEDRHSPYSGELISELDKPGVSVLDLFNNVGVNVQKNTDSQQIPWTRHSPMQHYCLAGCTSGEDQEKERLRRENERLQQQLALLNQSNPVSTPSQRLASMPVAGEERIFDGIAFVWVPAGEFMMGSNDGDGDEKPVHRVQIKQGFWLGKYELTQAQWQRVMGSNPSHFKGDNLPVE